MIRVVPNRKSAVAVLTKEGNTEFTRHSPSLAWCVCRVRFALPGRHRCDGLATRACRWGRPRNAITRGRPPQRPDRDRWTDFPDFSEGEIKISALDIKAFVRALF